MNLAPRARRMLTVTAAAAAIAGLGSAGLGAPPRAALADDPGCDVFGWRHPLCSGGAFDDSPAGTGIPQPGIGAEGGPWGGQMVPNTDGGLSTPGAPGAI